MKRIALLGTAVAFMGAGCWSSTPAPAPAPVQSPVLEQVQQPEVPSPVDTPVVVATATQPSAPSVTPPVSPSAEKPTPPPVVPPKEPEPVYLTVEMSQNGFKPAQITIKKDTIVRFKNVGETNMWPASNPHPAHTAYQDFDARRSVKPGETYEFRFKNAGTWGCHDHLSPGLTCRIVVQE